MCEVIKIARAVVFIVVFFLVLAAVFNGMLFCKRKKINFNTFSGMFEMYVRIIKFEERKFSIQMLACMYGGALLMLIIIGVSLWAEGKGCVFPTQYSK